MKESGVATDGSEEAHGDSKGKAVIIYQEIEEAEENVDPAKDDLFIYPSNPVRALSSITPSGASQWCQCKCLKNRTSAHSTTVSRRKSSSSPWSRN